MRKTFIVATLVALATAWAGYVTWPIYTLVTLTRAIERGDAATVVQHVDFNAMRISLTQQILDTYLKQSGKTVSPLLRGVTRSATSIAEPVVGRIVTPEALTEFLRTGWPRAVIAERPRDAAGLTFEQIGNVWQVFAASDYGIRRFDITIPASLPRDRQFRFRFRLKQWRWQLSSVRLPESIRLLLAEALVNALKPAPR